MWGVSFFNARAVKRAGADVKELASSPEVFEQVRSRVRKLNSLQTLLKNFPKNTDSRRKLDEVPTFRQNKSISFIPYGYVDIYRRRTLLLLHSIKRDLKTSMRDTRTTVQRKEAVFWCLITYILNLCTAVDLSIIHYTPMVYKCEQCCLRTRTRARQKIIVFYDGTSDGTKKQIF